jgi:hypothetical protein
MTQSPAFPPIRPDPAPRGRHRVPPARPGSRLALLLIGLLGVGLAVTGVVVAVGGGSAATCRDPDRLVVAAAPAVARIVRDAAARIGARDCVAAQVLTQDSATTAADLTDPTGMGHGSPEAAVPDTPAPTTAAPASSSPAPGAAAAAPAARPRPAMWIPDSMLWPRLAAGGALGTGPDATVDVRPPIAVTPLVVAAPRELAAATQAQASWSSVLSSSKPAVIADPVTSTSGLSTLAVISTVTGAGPDRQAGVVSSLIRVAHATVPDDAAAFAAAGSIKPVVFPASEQSIIAYDHSLGRADITAVYPREGTVPLEVPVVRLARPGDTPATGRAVDALERELRGPQTLRDLQDAGFRSPLGALADGYGVADGVAQEAPPQLPAPPADQLIATAQLWSAVTVDARLLDLVDVSGSMTAPAGGGRSRIQLAVEASLTGLSLFPDTSELGLWAFSANLDGPRPYTEVAPVRPLTDRLPSGQDYRDYLADRAKSLAGRVGGATGLYDTTLAAVRMMRAGYDPSKVNTITLTTDGRNESTSPLDLPTLLATLRAENDPTRPVAVIAVGIGPDADLDALRQIAAATGGKAYTANSPVDMQKVFLDAITLRPCRPNCRR